MTRVADVSRVGGRCSLLRDRASWIRVPTEPVDVTDEDLGIIPW